MNTISVRSFGYGVSQSIGDTLVTYMFTVARWGVLLWDFLTCEEVIATLRWLGAFIVALAELLWWSAVWVYAHIQQWAEREVQSCIQKPSMVPVEVMDIPAVNGLPSPTGTPSRDALRKEAKAKKIPGYSRMNKAQLLEALFYR